MLDIIRAIIGALFLAFCFVGIFIVFAPIILLFLLFPVLIFIAIL